MNSNLNIYDNLVQATKDLNDRGYKHDFQMEKDGLRCLKTGKIYKSSEMKIVEYHRLEGATNPSDMSIIYVIECNDNVNGIVISAYGTYADIALSEFMDKVKIKTKENITPN